MHDLRTYLWGCLVIAAKGSLHSASNWASVLGLLVVGAITNIAKIEIIFAAGWIGAIASILFYTAVAWVVIIMLRLILIAPYRLWKNERDEAIKVSTALSDAQRRLDQRANRRAAADTLANMLVDADLLCAKTITNDAEYEEVKKEFQEFASSISNKVRGHISDAELSILVSRIPADVIGRVDGYNFAHQTILHRLEILSRRLAKLVDKYAS